MELLIAGEKMLLKFVGKDKIIHLCVMNAFYVLLLLCFLGLDKES